MCGLIFPRQKYRIRSPSISAESPDPALPALVRTVFPDLPQQVFFGCFILHPFFPPHFDFKTIDKKKTPAPVFLQTAGGLLTFNTNHAIA